ncbi:MAG TPA: kelch repeat-containing protein [Deltaproteobacteria bacterium]|nr:kelch repeat-containing protein [Deltaproteobacteria bacterium]HPA84914.1 kelch repeat-containing protein [Deltaproteobacteria bacterium]
MKRHLCSRFVIGLTVLSTAVLPGCGGGSSSGSPGGLPSTSGNEPEISNLQYPPAYVALNSGGGSATIAGSIDFADPDGDPATFTIEIYDSGDILLASDDYPLPDLDGEASGTAEVSFAIPTDAEGVFTFQVFLTDETALDSNSLTGTFTVVEGDQWIWISGSDIWHQIGAYGIKGTPSPANSPGARNGAASWIDSSGSLWLFGGTGRDSDAVYGRINDLWKFDGTEWAWISGGDVCFQPGVYGDQGEAAPANVPGARQYSASWIDSSGNLWLFGGGGYDSAGDQGNLNDLWKFDGTSWTWISGSDVINQPGVYGTKGVSDQANVPGARAQAASWIDSSGNLWLFGGTGRDSAGDQGSLNDLWKFDGTSWTWISGSDVINQPGVYGTKGVSDQANVPGTRHSASSWIDSSGNLWLFGGYGWDSVGGGSEILNDLWKFDGTSWTWISGSNVITQPGVYGTKGVADPANIPGARYLSASWIDSSGNLWLFGGTGYDSAVAGIGQLNDLWKFDGTSWTWISGSDVINQPGVYGTKGVSDQANVPGARFVAASSIDSNGNLWLFGGQGYDSYESSGRLNDLWLYVPAPD